MKLQMNNFVNEESIHGSKNDLFIHGSFDEKINIIKRKFQELPTPNERYNLLIDLGRKLPSYPPIYKTEEFLVQGCQSQLFLFAEKKGEQIYFSASSDALISSGLAMLLILAYNGETMDTIISKPPLFLQEMGIYASLSPNRSNGLSQIYLKMKLLAILNGYDKFPSLDRNKSN